jgi:hypothetical protein
MKWIFLGWFQEKKFKTDPVSIILDPVQTGLIMTHWNQFNDDDDSVSTG